MADLTLKRLGWAGIELRTNGTRVVIDLLEDASIMERWVGAPNDELLPAAPGVDLALVTHLHLDHTDPPALKRVLNPGATVLRPGRQHGDGLEIAGVEPNEQRLAEAQLESRIVEPWETVEVDGIKATAVPAVDGTGDPQVSWVVEAGGKRILHAGDTMFHGFWWHIAMRTGPIDVAFLPVNGAVLDMPHRQPPSTEPAAMTAAQAAVAARSLGAKLAIPMHHTTFSRPPLYVVPGAEAPAFADACEELGVPSLLLAPGEELSLG